MDMQLQHAQIPPHADASNPKRRKTKKLSQDHNLPEVMGNNRGLDVPLPSMKPQKVSKKSLKKEPSPSSQYSDRSTPDSLQDSLRSNNEYHDLRYKYLLLEEESFRVGKELNEIEVEVKSLEDEKLALLDQLIVLEGLIDPSELQAHRGS